MISDERLNHFFINNPDLKETILSFYFGESNINNKLIYNIFYSRKTISSLALTFINIYKTQWLCNLIINIYPNKFKYVPTSMVTYQMSFESILSQIDNINYIRYQDELLDSLLTDLINARESIINQIPLLLISYKIWILIINQDIYKMTRIPSILITEEICYLVIKKDYRLFENLPINFKTSAMFLNIFNQGGDISNTIPNYLYTNDICKGIVTRDPIKIRTIPYRLRTREIWYLAVGLDYTLFCYMPNEFKNIQLCRMVVNINGEMLSHVPSNLRSLQVCLCAANNGANIFEFIPKEHLITCYLSHFFTHCTYWWN